MTAAKKAAKKKSPKKPAKKPRKILPDLLDPDSPKNAAQDKRLGIVP